MLVPNFCLRQPSRALLAIAIGLIFSPRVFAADQDTVPPAESSSAMYVSIRESLLTDKTFSNTAEGLNQLGINAIELSLDRNFSVHAPDADERVFLNSDDEVKAYRARAEHLGVRICAVLTACDFSGGDMESNITWIARAIEIAGLLGAPTVRIDSAMARERELDFEARVKLFADGLSGALNRTTGSKVTLGIENHGFQGNNLAFLLNVFKQVNSERLGSTLDLCNFYWRGYPLSEVYGILRLLAPYAKHTHVKNINYPAGQRETTREAGWEYGKYACPLDEGDIDLEKVLGILAAAGYKGDICIEDESLGKCATNAERIAVLQRDVTHIKNILE
jgi:sugar phosphate isomerase/epimerase